MSRVFVAEEHRFKRQVVVKVLSPELAAGLSVERFEREIQLAASLQQANIVPVLAAGESAGLPYFTMPFVEGESLRQRLDGPPIPIAEVLSILRDVARALAYAHARGVVHRDIKPDNVLLSGETAVVTDFGIAKAISASRQPRPDEGLTQVGTAIGTPAYMAPEQAAGDPDTDHRADVYAFGCLAYELLAGQPPFHGLTPHKLMVAHMAERPVPIEERREDVPAPLAALVARCLEKDPAHRPQQATELLQQLDIATTGARAATDATLFGPRATLGRALGVYALAFLAVAILARAAVVGIGLPAWVFPSALGIMALGLPMILLTGWTQRVQRRMAATPASSPGTGSTTAGDGARGGTMATLALRAAPHLSYRRAARMGAAVLATFIVVVGGFMALRALGIGPAGSLLAAGKMQASDQLLVTTFSTSNADTALGSIVAEAVKTTLGQSKVVRVAPTSLVSAALERMRRPPGTRLDLTLARELAQREGIKVIVTGNVAAVGGGFLLATRLVNAATGDELATFRETANGLNDLIPAIDRVTRALRERVGESLKSVRETKELAKVTTGSLDALREYTAGSAANGRGDYETAVAHFERAIALDTNFALAYSGLAGTLGNQNAQLRRRDTLLARAYALRDRLPERERLGVTVSYFRTGRAYDRGRAIAAAESIVRLDSNAAPALVTLAALYHSRAEYVRAESLYRRAIAIRGDVPLYYGNLVLALVAQRRDAAADSTVKAMHARGLTYPRVLQYQIASLYQRGLLDSAMALARQTAASPRPDVALLGAGAQGLIHGVRGQLGELWRIQGELRRQMAQRGSPSPPVYDSIARGFEDVWFRNDPARAAARISAAIRAQPIETLPENERPYLDLATLSAFAGRADEARRYLARFDATIKDPDLLRQRAPSRRGALAFIAIAEKRWDDALREANAGFRDADGGPSGAQSSAHFYRGYIHDLAGRPDSAIASFERYLTVPDPTRMSVDYGYLASVYRRLGELYEAKGNAARASDYYARFVELWKQADPEFQPRVQEVRARLDRLRRLTG